MREAVLRDRMQAAFWAGVKAANEPLASNREFMSEAWEKFTQEMLRVCVFHPLCIPCNGEGQERYMGLHGEVVEDCEVCQGTGRRP